MPVPSRSTLAVDAPDRASSSAERGPPARGWNRTSIVQLSPGARRTSLQSFRSTAKSSAGSSSLNVATTPAAVPALLTVTVVVPVVPPTSCSPKSIGSGVATSSGSALPESRSSPVPTRSAEADEPDVTATRSAERVPTAVGANRLLIVHDAQGGQIDPVTSARREGRRRSRPRAASRRRRAPCRRW